VRLLFGVGCKVRSEPPERSLAWGALALLGWSAWSSEAAALLTSARLPGGVGLPWLLERMTPWLIRALALLAAMGAGDFALARWRHRQRLLMTREEAVREQRASEGDPRQRGERRQVHRQLASGGGARGVAQATAVVVNPTHLAVALRFAPDECQAPYLVAKARDGDALALREEAARRGIPVVRDVPLARSLIHYDVGEEVPEELYRAAAAVLRVALENQESPS